MAEPLNAAAFAPFGDVLAPPAERGRDYFDAGLGNARAGARPSLSMSRVAPLAALPLKATMLERHEFSSQSFVPLDVARWLVIVAPAAPGGGPDAARARAFVAGPGQGITYHVGTWHHGLTVLDREARFAVFMWRDGSHGDEEFVPLSTPFDVVLPD
ncbi:ureidoglycolate lyase [Desertibaculum subflavum]|uniref:ureidoglycolate lyase n=1 Tax=Desertibaculum subflavum TaxID=2268458 RepID=UPI0013C4D8C7